LALVLIILNIWIPWRLSYINPLVHIENYSRPVLR
jgi:hypothetical protein